MTQLVGLINVFCLTTLDTHLKMNQHHMLELSRILPDVDPWHLRRETSVEHVAMETMLQSIFTALCHQFDSAACCALKDPQEEQEFSV